MMTAEIDLLRPLWRDAMAGIRIEVLKKANELDFWSLLSKKQRASELSVLTGLAVKEADFFLDILWSMNLLCRSSESSAGYEYWLNPQYVPFFDQKNELYFTDALFNRLESLGNYAAGISKLGNTGNQRQVPQNWQVAGKQHLYQDQQVLIAPLACSLVSQWYHYLPAAEKSHFLDLGGNPGNVALALLKKYPQFTGEIMDLPETQKVLAENIAQHNLDNRVKLIAGIFPEDSLAEEKYDLVWCSQLFYFLTNIEDGLNEIYRSLKVGGLLFFAHAEIANNPELASAILPWYMNMILKDMPVLREGQWQQQLKKAGFHILFEEYSESFPVSPLKLLIAQKL